MKVPDSTSSGRTFVSTVALAVVLIAAAPSNGHAPPRIGRAQPVASVAAAGQTLAFTPRVADGILLKVGGPGSFYFSAEFAPGETPSFVAIDDRGPLPDGRYRYELRTQPEVDERLLQIAEETDDHELLTTLVREETSRTLVQAGRFVVVGGAIALPGADRE